MRKTRCFVAMMFLVLTLGLVAVVLPAAQYAPPPAIKPSEETLKKIDERIDKLEAALKLFRRERVQDLIVADVEVYLKAAQWITQHNEFYDKDAGDWTLEVLERGLMRASQVKLGEWPWFQQTGTPVIHGYRSAIDGSVQPYAVTLPAEYGKGIKKWRLEVVLHGRQPSLTEVSFLHQFNGDKPAPKDQDYIRLDVYGRGNNGYRWAGESDLAEVLAHFFNLESNANKH